MILQYIVVGILVYWVLKIFVKLFSSGKSNIEVKGQSQNEPLDLKDQEVEDIDFKEIKE
ncbi:hypothetical protein JXQ31_01680 [candidate division KSB1 bacterium]|nr:hypothetical protein [candidate division KSB1 bacterium]